MNIYNPSNSRTLTS